MFITNNDYIVPPFNKFNNIPGPVENGSDYYPQYNKIWQVRSWEVLALIDDYNDNKKIDSKPSDHILSWPGRGNKYSKNYDGIIWPDRDLAPFMTKIKMASMIHIQVIIQYLIRHVPIKSPVI